jgi:hypothetical protein
VALTVVVTIHRFLSDGVACKSDRQAEAERHHRPCGRFRHAAEAEGLRMAVLREGRMADYSHHVARSAVMLVIGSPEPHRQAKPRRYPVQHGKAWRPQPAIPTKRGKVEALRRAFAICNPAIPR